MPPSGLGAAPAFGGAGADQVSLHVRQTAQHGQHEPAGAGAGIGPRLRQGPEPRPGIRDLLDDGEQVEGRARQAVDARHRHHVAGGELLEHLLQLLPVGPRPGRLLPMNPHAPGRLQLLKLGIKGLAIGADAGVADRPERGGCFGHILCKE